MEKTGHDRLLGLLGGKKMPTAEEFKELVKAIDNHRILAKVFLLEGTPFVFEKSPMKYVIFRKQVADQFDVGSQDICIVGSAKLGFSPSPHANSSGSSIDSNANTLREAKRAFYGEDVDLEPEDDTEQVISSADSKGA